MNIPQKIKQIEYVYTGNEKSNDKIKLIEVIDSYNALISYLSEKEEKPRIGFLRQWLNEDRITELDRMVTNEQIETMLYEPDQKTAQVDTSQDWETELHKILTAQDIHLHVDVIRPLIFTFVRNLIATVEHEAYERGKNEREECEHNWTLKKKGEGFTSSVGFGVTGDTFYCSK